jgi:hypothetical protein
MITAARLAAQLGVSEGDIVVLLEDLGTPADAIPDDIADDIRLVLDPFGVRTGPPELYWPGETATASAAGGCRRRRSQGPTHRCDSSRPVV